MPSLIGTALAGAMPEERIAEVETILFLALAALGLALTGGLATPMAALLAPAIGGAWSTGRRRFILETGGLSGLTLVLAGWAGSYPGPLGEEAASAFAQAFGLAGLVMLLVQAGLGAGAPSRPVPLKEAVRSGVGPDPALALKLRQAEVRLKAAEEEVGKARLEAQVTQDRLEARTRFFAQTSHELRTPLNAIIGFADMMKNAVFGPLSEKYVEYAGLIQEGGRTLEIVVDDVLDLSRIEAGRYEISPDLVSLTDLAAEAVRFMEDVAIRRSVALELEEGGDVEAFADPRAVRQIALNLISNALKFTPEGGAVTVAAISASGGALLSVSDTGAGIGEEELERLSRAFEQGEEGRKHKGSGLGLSVVRAFAELHGGRLDIESRSGGGSTIAVFFPGEPGAP
jgi:signal transduction histidine kinase